MEAEKLPHPGISEPFDVEIDIGDLFLVQKRFSVSWKPFSDPEISIDPIVELWRPLNERLREDTDLNLGIFKHGPDSVFADTTIRTYEVSYGPINRKGVPVEVLSAEVDDLVPRMLDMLTTVCDEWSTADNGLALFLKERNKSSIDRYLIGIGLKRKPTQKKKMSKEERRKAYLDAHPEHAKTAAPKASRKKTAQKP